MYIAVNMKLPKQPARRIPIANGLGGNAQVASVRERMAKKSAVVSHGGYGRLGWG